MRPLKRILTVVVGGGVLLAGVALIVLPGPAVVAIPLGLAILAAEFAWARRWLRSARAVLPLKTRGGPPGRKFRVTLKSARRSAEFLFRQFRRTLTRRRTPSFSRS